MDAWQLVVYGVIGMGVSILSGIAGAGGGFVMTPLLIVLGLTPAQAVSSGKFNGLAVTLGSLSSLRKYNRNVSKRRIFAVMALAFAVGLLAPFAIKSFNGHWYRLVLGTILLLMVPVMIHKRVGVRPSNPSPARKTLGSFLLAVSLFLQGAFSGGLGSLVNIVLMGMLGQTANEAHLTKRYSQLVLNITVILGLLGAHLIIWPVVAVGVCINFAGGYIGSHIAVKKGDKFAVDTLIGLMVVSALVLILGAL